MCIANAVAGCRDCGLAKQAAIRAGYSAKTAAGIGHQNLTKLNVAEAIEKAPRLPDQSRIGGRRGDQRDAPAAYGGWVDHPIGSQLGALGALRPGLFDLRGDMRFYEVFVADLGRGFGAVTDLKNIASPELMRQVTRADDYQQRWNPFGRT